MPISDTEKIHNLIKSSDSSAHELAYLLLKSHPIKKTREIVHFFERSFQYFKSFRRSMIKC